MQPLSSSERLKIVVKDVQLSPLSIGIWAAGIGAGAFGYLWVFGLVVLLQLARTYITLNNETYLKKLFAKRQEKAESLSDEQVEAILEKMDFETRQRLRYVLQLQKEIIREARGEDVEKYVAESLERIVQKLFPLTSQAIRLADRKQKLAKYLYNVDERALNSYCVGVQKRIKETNDPVQRAQYEQALRSRQNELDTYRSIAQAAARIDSQLENVEATFASWKAKVIRIKTADVNSAASASEGLYMELDSLSSEINILDSSVSEALAPEQEVGIH